MTFQTIKRSDLGSGAATPFNPNIIAIDIEDLLNGECPEANEGGVLVESDIVLKAGASPFKFYVTAISAKIGSKSTGEIDSEGYEVTFEATMPGDNLITREFSVWALKRNFIILVQTCKGGNYDMFGDCCNPMRLGFEIEKDKDKTQTKVMMKRPLNTDEPAKIYAGNLTFVDPFAVTTTAIDLTLANGKQYAIDATVTGALTIATNTLVAGDKVTFIGNGGTTPATLDASATVLLKDGTTWTALKDAIITLQVFDDGTNLVLVEVERR